MSFLPMTRRIMLLNHIEANLYKYYMPLVMSRLESFSHEVARISNAEHLASWAIICILSSVCVLDPTETEAVINVTR
jgi:hypothetical protein